MNSIKLLNEYLSKEIKEKENRISAIINLKSIENTVKSIKLHKSKKDEVFFYLDTDVLEVEFKNGIRLNFMFRNFFGEINNFEYLGIATGEFDVDFFLPTYDYNFEASFSIEQDDFDEEALEVFNELGIIDGYDEKAKLLPSFLEILKQVVLMENVELDKLSTHPLDALGFKVQNKSNTFVPVDFETGISSFVSNVFGNSEIAEIGNGVGEFFEGTGIEDTHYSLRTKGLPYLSDLRISKEKNLIEMLNNLELSFEDKINFKTISSLNEKDSYREISFRQGITTIGMALTLDINDSIEKMFSEFENNGFEGELFSFKETSFFTENKTTSSEIIHEISTKISSMPMIIESLKELFEIERAIEDLTFINNTNIPNLEQIYYSGCCFALVKFRNAGEFLLLHEDLNHFLLNDLDVF